MQELRDVKKQKFEILRDPDPFSITLSMLGALGSVTSIVSLKKQHDEKQCQLQLGYEKRSQLLDHYRFYGSVFSYN